MYDCEYKKYILINLEREEKKKGKIGYETEARAGATLESGEYIRKLHDTRVTTIITSPQSQLCCFTQPTLSSFFSKSNFNQFYTL